jgi:Fur family transcriptional regulator, ferric uptake regulator
VKTSPTEAAQNAIRKTGARVTLARVQVLALLLREEQALTHHQIESKLRRVCGTDRVTIYRVLEWLIQNGLVNRVAVGDRAWRFDAIASDQNHTHAHFRCGACGTVTCLDEVREPPKVTLPVGYSSSAVELTIKGLCAVCVPTGERGKNVRATGNSR